MRNPIDVAARLRGAFVGSASGAMSIAAHALGGGAFSPGASSTALLIAACTAVGVLVAARPNRHRPGEVMAMLAIGQTVAHIALTLSAGHQHDAGTPTVLLGAHLTAVPVGALLIRTAEHAALRAASDLRRTVRILSDGPTAFLRICSPAIGRPRPGPRRLLVCSGFGLRGPPTRHRPSSCHPRTPAAPAARNFS
ncbi:hypothetical protein OHB12_09545 [Nocardia sp. NBC_01730]|uniref:hypothetical protein n=1 Tax=Nocardia sp. NBC_01730 TaxID=2975998 RepID=UPI002E128F85|nr:hypothetical protein OHB12_09545 [Nocardia sp. NBC_01730]